MTALTELIRRSLLGIGRGGGLLLLLAAPVGIVAAEPTEEPVPLAAAGSVPPLTLGQVVSRLKELESATTMEEAERARLQEVYRQIQTRLEEAARLKTLAETFDRALQTAPAEVNRLREALRVESQEAGLEEPPLPEEEPDTEALQARLQQETAALTALRARLTETEQQRQQEEERPTAARTQLAEAKTRLATVQAELSASPAPAADATEAERAPRALLETRSFLRDQEIKALELELQSNAVRVELLRLTRDDLTRRTTRQETLVNTLEDRLAARRQLEAAEAQRAAERLRREAIGKHPLVHSMATNIAGIATRTLETTQRAERWRSQWNVESARLARLQDDLSDTRRTLDLNVRDQALGTLLAEQHRSLPDPVKLDREIEKLVLEISRLRLQMLQLDRQLKDLANAAAVVDGMLAGLSQPVEDEAARQELRTELLRLAGTQREELERHLAALRSARSEAGRMEANQRDLLKTTIELEGLLAAQLAWMQNAPALNLGLFGEAREETAFLLRGLNWVEVRDSWSTDFVLHPLLHGLVLLAAAALLVFRPRLRRLFHTIAPRLRSVREDRLRFTLQAAVLNVLVAMPVPLLLGFLAWRLAIAGVDSEFTRAVSAGLTLAAITTFVIRLLQALTRPNGLGEAHFRWHAPSMEKARKELLWFLPVAATCAFLLGWAESFTDPSHAQRAGRYTFMFAMLSAAVVAWRVFHPRDGLRLQLKNGLAPGWLMRSRPLWYGTIVGAPLLLAGLAGLGFTFLAREFALRLVLTLLSVQGVVVLHAVLHRWLVLSQRRLAWKLAVEKREALARSRESGEIEDAADGVVEMLEEIDVAEIKEQTLDLLRISLGVLLLVAMWFVWSGVLPVLHVLDEVEFWHHTVIEEGTEVLRPVTLTNLLGAGLLLLLTATAARNMPGFLEIALLQRLPLDPGARYATRTLALYLIVGVGLLLALNTLGLRWSSIQWLAAALTVGLGFGLQEIFANFVSGVILLLERPIRVGDTVTVGSISGVVTRIRMRATTITDWTRKELIVPNRNFITGELVNWSLSDPILRLDFMVGIAYGSDTALAQKVMTEACRSHPSVLKQPEANVFFVQFGDNSLNFEVRIFVAETTNAGRTRIIHDLHMAIDQSCREHDITIAFPQRDLHLKTSETILRVAQVRPDGSEIPLPAPRSNSQAPAAE